MYSDGFLSQINTDDETSVMVTRIKAVIHGMEVVTTQETHAISFRTNLITMSKT